jgi:hypothetical protein
MCAVLAHEAARRGAEYFCFTNADILFSQAAIDIMLRDAREGYAFTRMDIDAASGADLAMHLGGVDAVAATRLAQPIRKVRAWLRHELV